MKLGHLASAALAALLLAPPCAFAQDAANLSLRERIKERREHRRVDSAKPDAAASGSSAAAQLSPGNHTLQLDFGGKKRKYIVHVPPSYSPSKPAALVVAFHGGGGHAEYMADDAKYGLSAKADQANFVVVFPNGYSKVPGGRFATWNAGGCCGDARDRSVDDVGFARALVAAVSAQVNVDSSRVYATGMSNGGMMSHRLACDAADLFRAVASVAGTDATDSCSPSRPLSVLHIHAKNDDHVLYGGGAGPGAFRETSKVMEFTSVPETVARWVTRNQCGPTPTRTLNKIGAYCENYTGCAEGVQVQVCVTEDGGHSWPGAQTMRRGKEPASSALNANDAIWDFFQASPPR